MGCAITQLIESNEIQIENLSGKVLAVDALNVIFQFLTTIRQRDGTPLIDSRGKITSHLNGLFNRTTSLMASGLKLIFVFDGDPPKLKAGEQLRRKELKREAMKKFEEAKEKDDIHSMRKYSSRMHHLNEDMIEESKELLRALGLPVIQAPSEGEAQASYLVKKEEAFAVVSQDADSLLFGAEKVVKNLSIAGKRKKVNRLSYEIVKPELISLSNTLNVLGITQEQLIVLGILVGTDYNPGGVLGLGPKKGLKLVKEFGSDFDKLFSSIEWSFDFSWRDVYDLFVNIPVSDEYKLEWGDVDTDRVKKLLCGEHDFSEQTVDKKLKKLIEFKHDKKQGKLEKWF